MKESCTAPPPLQVQLHRAFLRMGLSLACFSRGSHSRSCFLYPLTSTPRLCLVTPLSLRASFTSQAPAWPGEVPSLGSREPLLREVPLSSCSVAGSLTLCPCPRPWPCVAAPCSTLPPSLTQRACRSLGARSLSQAFTVPCQRPTSAPASAPAALFPGCISSFIANC